MTAVRQPFNGPVVPAAMASLKLKFGVASQFHSPSASPMTN